jgi:CRP-like cAMP-binding protein
MPSPRSTRVLPDGTPLQNRLLAATPFADYDRLRKHLRMVQVGAGEALHDHTTRVTDVYFPNGGVFSISMRMRSGAAVEVATVGREGMLGIGVFLGDRTGAGYAFQQVADGALPSMSAARFLRESAQPGPFRTAVEAYAQANLLQIMQGAACNALHDVTQRCCRRLLQTHDRVDADDFPMKQEFLAVTLGVRRPTVTDVMRTLSEAGLVSSGYGRIRILDRRRLEAAACECYGVIRVHFARRGM